MKIVLKTNERKLFDDISDNIVRVNEINLIITQHCKERYAERIMGRDVKCDIAIYIAQNQDKIEEDINKMATYGEILYVGPLKDKNIVNVILNGSWVLLTDRDMKKAITMYKIDFGLGEEFNKDFVAKMREKIDISKNHLKEVELGIEIQKKTYKEAIYECDRKIKDAKNLINTMTTQLNAYQDLIKTADAEKIEAEDLVRNNIMNLVCKKEF